MNHIAQKKNWKCWVEGGCNHYNIPIAVFTQGPGPRAANFQGRHIKKNRDWNMVCGKKRLSTREKFKGDLFCILETHYNVLSFVSFLCCFCLHITEYEQIRGEGGTKFSWAQGRKIPKYGPGGRVCSAGGWGTLEVAPKCRISPLMLEDCPLAHCSQFHATNCRWTCSVIANLL